MHYKKTQKSFFVNNFYETELQILRFLTQNKTMVTQISAVSATPNFNPENGYVKKLTVFTFQ